MVRLQELSEVVKSVKYATWCKEHYHPNIDEKVLIRVTKEFDSRIVPNRIAAIIDTSLSFKCKAGTVYTLTGVYDKGTFEKPYYFNYSDILEYSVNPDKKGRTDGLNGTLVIQLKNGESYSTTNEAIAMKQILDKIMVLISTWDDLFDGREAGQIQKHGLTEKQLKKCHAIIHAASVAAGGVGTGLAQIPLSDNAIITPIQATMVSSLGLVFDIRLTEGAVKGIIGSMAAAFVGRSVSQVLVGWMPVIGNAINTATAAGITEAVGWAAVKHFAQLNEEDRAKYRVEGMKDGYAAASDEYEAKLKNQADLFIKQKNYAKEQRDQYEKLLSEYEAYIKNLEEQIETLKKAKGLEIPEYIIKTYKDMVSQYNILRDLKKCS